MLDKDQITQVAGRDVHGPDGDKIGRAGRVYVDDQTGSPKWVSVETGFFGTRASFIPLEGAAFDGERLTVPYAKSRVKGAPDLGDADHLSPEDEGTLNQYYSGADSDDADDAGSDDRLRDRDHDDRDHDDRDHDDRDHLDRTGRAGHGVADAPGPDDDAMTVSEEQLAVSTRSVPTERVRLRKHVVTEEVTLTVTLRKERLTIEREPIGESEVGNHVGGSDFDDKDQEIVLYEEVPVVQKVLRPIERIRLATEVTTEQQTVSGEVRKERVEADRPSFLTDRDTHDGDADDREDRRR